MDNDIVIKLKVKIDLSSVIQDSYTIKEITQYFNIPRERLRGWMKNGYFQPSVQVSKSRGKAHDSLHIFSKSDVYKMLLFVELVKIGLSCSLAKDLIYDKGGYELIEMPKRV